MYIFPRQFGLHNVFTDDVDPRQTVQPFKDYTLREDEINARYSSAENPKIPKRLRGQAVQLVRKLQIQHARCPYKKLLEHYCPVISLHLYEGLLTLWMFEQAKNHNVPEPVQSLDTSKFQTQIPNSTPPTLTIATSTTKAPPRKESMLDHSTSASMVSAFCRAVLSRLLPSEFWGTGRTKIDNERVFLQNVDRFIGLRRFESLSLHEVSQGLKASFTNHNRFVSDYFQISDVEWLSPPNTDGNKLSQADTNKRWEIFHEFTYYVFDSILIPLIRANFHVTESVHKHRLFYFRHDVWRSLAEPALAKLKASMFEEVKLEKARNTLESRILGFAQVRLQPKETGVRPIMNLKRRALKPRQKTLGFSINSVLAPVYNVFTLEAVSKESNFP